jgi:hypothetical protein
MKRTIILALAAASLALAQPPEPRQVAIAAGAGGGFMHMNPGCDLGRSPDTFAPKGKARKDDWDTLLRWRSWHRI